MSQPTQATNDADASPGSHGNEMNQGASPVRRIRALISGTAQNYRDLSPFKFKTKARVLNPELSVDHNSGSPTTKHMTSGSSVPAASTASEQLESILKREVVPVASGPATEKFMRPNSPMKRFRSIVADANYTFGGLASKIVDLKNDQKALDKELMQYLRNAHGLMDQIADVLDAAIQTKTGVEAESEAYKALLKSEEDRIAKLRATVLDEEVNLKEVVAKMKLEATDLESNITKMKEDVTKLGEEIEELQQDKEECMQQEMELRLEVEGLRDEAVELGKKADSLELKSVKLKEEVATLDAEKRKLVAETAWWVNAKNEHHQEVVKVMDKGFEVKEEVEKLKDEKMKLDEAEELDL